YSGRRVDLLGRSLPAEPGADPADVLRRYLVARRTDSAKALAAKAVVLIYPQNRAGEIVWPAASPVSLTHAHAGARIDARPHRIGPGMTQLRPTAYPQTGYGWSAARGGAGT